MALDEPDQIEISTEELEALLGRVRSVLTEEDYQKLAAVVRTLGYVTKLLENREATLGTLRRLLCRSSTEKTAHVLKQAGIETENQTRRLPKQRTANQPTAGHGRNGAARYRGAEKITVPHASLKTGDRCLDSLCGGKVYPLRQPGVLVRIRGQAPVAATVYELEKLRCNLCQKVFTADAPEEAGEKKYDETAAAMIALLRYGSGFPWYRLKGLEAGLGIPLPVATQCEIVAETAPTFLPALEELIRQAAEGEVMHNDDTSMRVLSLGRNRGSDSEVSPERTGVFTSGIVSIRGGRRIALFFTGRKHAGENLADVLERRPQGLSPPIQMCDALSRNLPKSLQVIVAHCLAHGRRNFVEVIANFPAECRFVLETLGEVYGYDEQAREQGMSPEERLRFHQEHSAPVMEKLHTWLNAQSADNNVEPNSGLGKAISYLLRYWERLTLFLRQAGTPLDNNIVERGLKKAILHRKNSLFYKTRNGARMGDLFMSLIHTCELNGANPFDYLTELQRHADELKANPADWMPWNYPETLLRLTASPAA
jgi:transposase